jgi:hypothetical protein
MLEAKRESEGESEQSRGPLYTAVCGTREAILIGAGPGNSRVRRKRRSSRHPIHPDLFW